MGTAAWTEIRTGLRAEAQRWLDVLQSPREVSGIELAGMIGSIAHLAYHLGAIRRRFCEDRRSSVPFREHRPVRVDEDLPASRLEQTTEEGASHRVSVY